MTTPKTETRRPMLLQLLHNDGSGPFVFAYDKDDTEKMLSALERDNAELRAALEEAERRIQLAGGYHARTEREIEIENALHDTRPDLWDSSNNAIDELLALVDAGRNRVHQERENAERLTADNAEMRKALEKAAPEHGVNPASNFCAHCGQLKSQHLRSCGWKIARAALRGKEQAS